MFVHQKHLPPALTFSFPFIKERKVNKPQHVTHDHKIVNERYVNDSNRGNQTDKSSSNFSRLNDTEHIL